MSNLTILYITANREYIPFEQKIREKLLEVSGNNPIISISQKPITLGKNICVGEVGVSYRNANLQLLTGAKEADTEYVAIAESDQLYPPGYFDFKPDPTVEVYMYNDLRILRCWDKNRFWKKAYGDWTVIVKRSYFINRLQHKLTECGGSLNWGMSKIGSTFRKRYWTYFDVGMPVISIKTVNNLSRVTGVMEELGSVSKLPYWGKAQDLSKYLELHNRLDL